MTLELKVAIAGIGQRGLQHLENLLELENKGIVKIQALIDPFHGNLLEANIQQKIPKYSRKDFRLSYYYGARNKYK